MRFRQQRGAFVQGTGTIVFLRSKDCGRTGVDKSLQIFSTRSCRLENVNRSDNINHGTKPRIRPAGRHLEPCQVNDVVDLLALDFGADLLRVTDITTNELHPRQCLRVQQKPEALGLKVEVKDKDVLPAVHQILHSPSPDAALSPGDKITCHSSNLRVKNWCRRGTNCQEPTSP